MTKYGQQIPKAQWKTKIQPGDLVFLSGHVQIYVGNSEVVEIKGAGKGSYMTKVEKNKIPTDWKGDWKGVVDVRNYFGADAKYF